MFKLNYFKMKSDINLKSKGDGMTFFRNKQTPGMVESIIVVNVVVFILCLIYKPLTNYLSLRIINPALVIPDGIYAINNGAYWQLLTSMFMHSPYNFSHILFNMYGLYIFGKPLEMRWGKVKFLSFYLTVGVLANIASVFFYFFTGINQVQLIGASGAVYGVLLAFGGYFPETQLLLFFFIPIKVKWSILLFTGISLFFEISGSMGGIAHITHLFGFVFAFLYLFLFFKMNAVKEMYFPNRHRFYYDNH
jgi:membrane associated rhomboid family serine protease